MANYKIIKGYVHNSEDLKKEPVKVSLVELLTNRKEGLSINVVVFKPKFRYQQERVNKGEIISEPFALNYGPEGFYYYVIIDNIKNITQKLSEAPPFNVMDNAFDDKIFFKSYRFNALSDWWREADKFHNPFTFIGDINDFFREFKEAGYKFSNKKYKGSSIYRTDKVHELLKEAGKIK